MARQLKMLPEFMAATRRLGHSLWRQVLI
ncbi:hypothetical protein LINPERPRIM_LOCUS2791 [Linum perenne]